MRELTQKEKWECAIRWTDAGISAYFGESGRVEEGGCRNCPRLLDNSGEGNFHENLKVVNQAYLQSLISEMLL